MRAQPPLEPVHRQRLECRPALRPAHQPLHRRPGRSPKRADEGPAARPLLHRRRREVRLPRGRMHVANSVSERGPHPGLPRIGQCSGFRNPSARDRRRRGRWPLGGRSPRIRTGERHLPRSGAFPARDRPRYCGLEPPWNRLGRGTRQIRHRRVPAMACRRRSARRSRWGTARGCRHVAGPGGKRGARKQPQQRRRCAIQGAYLPGCLHRPPQKVPTHSQCLPQSTQTPFQSTRWRFIAAQIPQRT